MCLVGNLLFSLSYICSIAMSLISTLPSFNFLYLLGFFTPLILPFSFLLPSHFLSRPSLNSSPVFCNAKSLFLPSLLSYSLPPSSPHLLHLSTAHQLILCAVKNFVSHSSFLPLFFPSSPSPPSLPPAFLPPLQLTHSLCR